MNDRAHAALGIALVALVAIACKKGGWVPPAPLGMTDASDDAALLSGSCSPIEKPRCQPGGKAAFCLITRNGRWTTGQWKTFTCAGCSITTFGVPSLTCDEVVEGEPCGPESTKTNNVCTKDGSAIIECDLFKNEWKRRECPKGCTGDMRSGTSCPL
jgi:hypothetical protein